MLTQAKPVTDKLLQLHSCIQKVATGPEYSKDLSLDEAQSAMGTILAGEADPVQSGILLISLRMKRETDEENRGILRAIRQSAKTASIALDELIDVADPYDGYSRGLPPSPFLPAVLAASGLPAVSHGLDAVGPKYGITHRKVLRAAGVPVDLSPAQAASQIEKPDIGWAYVDQKAYCPALHELVGLRSTMVKRTVLTTVEVLVGPLRARNKTHLLTGYVHKAYPPIYASLAQEAGFDSAAIVRGVEGGIIPSLQQPARVFHYDNSGEAEPFDVVPQELGIQQNTRAVPLPTDLPEAAPEDAIASTVNSNAAADATAKMGLAALSGESGPGRDALVYGGAIMLYHLRRADSLRDAAERIRSVLDSGEALRRFEAARNN